MCLCVFIEPFPLFIWSVQAPPDWIQHRVLLLCQGKIPSHARPVSVIRMAVYNHTSRYFPPVAQEQILSFLLSTYSGKLLTEVLHCLCRSCLCRSIFVQTWMRDMYSFPSFLPVCLQIRWSASCSGWLWVLLSPCCVCVVWWWLATSSTNIWWE